MAEEKDWKQWNAWEDDSASAFQSVYKDVQTMKRQEGVEKEKAPEKSPLPKNGRKSRLTRLVRSSARVVTDTVKSTASQVNPLEQKINREEVTDTGAESLRLAVSAYKKGKHGVKTAKSTIRTTKSTIRMVRQAPRMIRKTAVNVVKTVKTTVRVVQTTVKVVARIATEVVAMATNPIFWVIVAVLLIAYAITSAGMLLISGAEFQQEMDAAYGVPIALGDDIPKAIKNGIQYFKNACVQKKTEWDEHIDGLYYAEDNLQESDLLYMERTEPPLTYAVSLATPARKDAVKDAWMVNLNVVDALALVYIRNEQQLNEEKDTEMSIINFEFTQEQFDTLLNDCVSYVESIYYGQECPDKNCTRKVISKPNEEYEEYSNLQTQYANAYNSWGGICVLLETWNSMTYPASDYYWNNTVLPAVNEWQSGNGIALSSNWDSNLGSDFLGVLGTKYQYYENLVNTTPPTIETEEFVCDYQHTTFALRLQSLDAGNIMENVYHFSDAEKAWYIMIHTSIQKTILQNNDLQNMTKEDADASA